MSVLSQLSEEHSTLLPIISQMQALAEVGEKAALLKLVLTEQAVLKEQLDAHIVLEEEAAFPMLAALLGADLIPPFQEEHREIRALRDGLLAEAASGTVSPSICLVLCDLIIGHMEREDGMLFPSATEVLHPTRSHAYS